jgi:dipeptidyl aminopeptidase/acylaminoacyl peptidase
VYFLLWILQAFFQYLLIQPLDLIGVAGASAGGHLAELVATADQSAGLEGNGGWQNVSSKVQAAAAYYGVSDFTVGALQFQHHTGQVVVKLFRGREKEKPELYRKASPIFYVSKDDPPLLLAHGEKDDLVPFEQSARMAAAYRRVGLSVEFIAVKNAGHDFEQVGDAPVSPSVEVALRSAADERRQHWMEARDWYQKSLDSWRQISNPGAVSPDGWPCGNSREVANAVAICDRVLHSGNVSASATPVTVPSRQ